MKVTLDRTFPMPAGVDATWATLADIETVASCMPGAKITERVDDSHYKGAVTVKVGPAMLAFRGDIEVKEKDAAARSLRLVAKGTDTSGTSAASLDLTARVEPDGANSNLVGHAESTVSGKAATFGGRLMDAVADQILKQFAANFATRVAAAQPPSGGGTANPAPDAGSESRSMAASASAPELGSESRSAPPAAATPPATQPLNGLALLWAVIKDWLRGLFAKKTV